MFRGVLLLTRGPPQGVERGASSQSNPKLALPMHRQLYAGFRDAILEGTLKPGTRLLSTRSLANDLGTSRTTVILAFDQLLAEGYLECRVGDGT